MNKRQAKKALTCAIRVGKRRRKWYRRSRRWILRQEEAIRQADRIFA